MRFLPRFGRALGPGGPSRKLPHAARHTLYPMATEEIHKTDEQWREELSPEQYDVLRKGSTERAFTGKYWNVKQDGVYRCAGCGAGLFSSDTKFDSGTGWPSFTEPAVAAAVETRADNSLFMRRTEVVCRACGGHLGHVFEDGPRDKGGLRYCINSCALELDPGDGTG
jgi:peptide-methionine (R)-S-oxide reductase